MPGAPTGVGYGVFLGAKLAGYLGVARALKTAYPEATHSTIKVGLTRTGIGVTAGLAYGAIWIWLLEKALVPHVSEMTMLSIYYFALLLPLRVGEWGFTIWLFFDRGISRQPQNDPLDCLRGHWLLPSRWLGPGRRIRCSRRFLDLLNRWVDFCRDLIESSPLLVFRSFHGPC